MSYNKIKNYHSLRSFGRGKPRPFGGRYIYFKLFISLVLLVKEISFGSRMIKAEGVIENIRERESNGDSDDGDTSTFYFPIVKFCDLNGETIEFVGLGSQSRKDIYEGKPIEVIYDKENSKSAKINEWSNRWGLSLTLFLGSLIFIFIGLKI